MTTGAKTLQSRQLFPGKADSQPLTRESPTASTQNQALSALLFLYRHVIGSEIGDLGDAIRARKPKRLPVVMTRDEIRSFPSRLTGDKWPH